MHTVATPCFKSVKLSYVLMKLEIEKKGKTTDYVARQYIGNLGKLKMASFL